MTRFALTALALMIATPLQAQTEGLVLTLLDGAAPGFEATLSFEQPGMVFGRAPCNRYSAQLDAPLPAFKPKAIMSTRMACPALDAEQQFFDLLGQMDQAELGDGVVTLTGAGHVMVFSSRP